MKKVIFLLSTLLTLNCFATETNPNDLDQFLDVYGWQDLTFTEKYLIIDHAENIWVEEGPGVGMKRILTMVITLKNIKIDKLEKQNKWITQGL